jgi:hypothetical protein
MPEELSDFSECFITGTAQARQGGGWWDDDGSTHRGLRDGATF